MQSHILGGCLCIEVSLCSFFPFSYEAIASKVAKVVELWEGMGSGGGWNFKFERLFNDWEMEEVQRFMITVNSKTLRFHSSDRLRWKETKDGIFTVKSSFDLLEGGIQQLVPVKMIWNSIVPTKVGVFCVGDFVGKDSDYGLAKEKRLFSC